MTTGVDEKGLGRHLQERRRAAGLTQQQLCQKTGLSYSTLAKIERGAIKAPSIFTVRQIAAALNTSLNDLVGGEADRPISAKTRSKSGIRFVFFDINGCLVRFFHRAFTRLAEETGMTSDVVETAFWHYNDAVCRGDISIQEFNNKLAKRLNVKSLNWQDYYLSVIDPIPQMHELLHWASQHYHVGLMSNIMPGFIGQMLKRGLIPDLNYDVVIDSSQIGSIKPERKIYEVAQKKADCQPGEILLVDDSRSNIMAAEKLGWRVLWFDDYRPSESAKHVRAALEPEQ